MPYVLRGTRGGPLLAVLAFVACAQSPEASVQPDAGTVHREAVVFDAHAHPNTAGSEGAAPEGGGWAVEADLASWVEGEMDAAFLSLPFLGEAGGQGPDSSRVFAGIRAMEDVVEGIGDRVEMALSAEDVRRIQALGKRAVLLSIEARDPIHGHLGVLERYHAAGIRMITLSPQPDEETEGGGADPDNPPLGPFGRDMVRAMNRLGILIDITHTPDRQQLEIVRASSVPVVASHSNARALLNVPREIPDSIILAIAGKGGMVGVTFHPGHLSEGPEGSPVTVEDLADHIDHMVRMVGVDHVGFGSDFIGGETETVGLESPAGLPNLTRALLARGYSTEEIHKILGGNLLRVLEEVQQGAG